ncbi:fibrinogen-like protein 1 [Gigantopelta aegis]|uniref:fibrinogen-like protein 1 n=1 Tax=Gigantopelta aegis TaxID=1735272 RepID=UPI001B88BA78|nr:fibrinogen-like protein 1 [Gigantopelta aegis]
MAVSRTAPGVVETSVSSSAGASSVLFSFLGAAKQKEPLPAEIAKSGNTNIHRLTSQKPHELMVDLERFNGEIRHAAYSSFSVASESKKFKLHVSGYSGNAGDSFVYHNGQFFSTGDQDNDPFQMVSCAEGTAGGWWFNTCLTCNLNGFWYSSETQLVRDMGITWSPDWINIYSSLKTSAMKIRPVNDTLLP